MDGKTVGFLANYDQEEREAPRDATVRALGETRRVQNPTIGSLSSEQWNWDDGDKRLVFGHFSGTDIRANPLAELYTIMFGPVA